MQADGRFVEDVTDAAQVGAELRREADPLRFAAAQRRRGAVEREIRQADLVEKPQARLQFRDDVAGDLRVASAQFECAEMSLRFGDRPRRHLRDVHVLELHRQRFRTQPLSVTGGAGAFLAFEPFVPPDFFAGVLFVEPVEQQSRAVATRAPAVFRVEREQARIEFLETAAAFRAGAAGGKQCLRGIDEPWEVNACSRGLIEIIKGGTHLAGSPSGREPTITRPFPNSSAASRSSRNSRSFSAIPRMRRRAVRCCAP